MGKKWVMLLVIALVGILATTVYAEPKMVIVLEPGNTKFFKCYEVGTFTPETSTTPPAFANFNPCEPDGNGSSTYKIRLKSRGHGNAEHTILKGPDGGTLYANPCVTYWYGGHSYTVCN